MTYTYALLDPRPTPEAQAHNDAIFAARPVFGVEVTVPALAGRCVANLDPQHLGGDAGTSAIEAALTWDLPPAGSTLATIRPDPDAFGAIAILAWRRNGAMDLEAVVTRVHVVAVADREAAGPWPGRRPLRAYPGDLVGPCAALGRMCMDSSLSIAERVQRMGWWLTEDDLGGVDGLHAYQEAAVTQAAAALRENIVTERAGIAVVKGTHRLASEMGYHLSPVVVASNPAFRFQGGEPHLKHTVCRWNSDVPMDWAGMLAELRAREPGWGGSTSICGSPQGVGSTLTTDEVVEIATRNMLN